MAEVNTEVNAKVTAEMQPQMKKPSPSQRNQNIQTGKYKCPLQYYKTETAEPKITIRRKNIEDSTENQRKAVRRRWESPTTIGGGDEEGRWTPPMNLPFLHMLGEDMVRLKSLAQ